jgi:putative FmdB family regulatory protein
MPIFEYVCEACRTRYEQLAANPEVPGACPSCGSERRSLRFSVFSAPKSNGAASGIDSACACTPSGCGCR